MDGIISAQSIACLTPCSRSRFWHRPPVRGADGGGQMTFLGGDDTYLNENGRRGGKRRIERDARTGKVAEEMELGRGNLGEGEREGVPQSSMGQT